MLSRESVVLVEDDKDYAEEVAEFLDAHGFVTSHVSVLAELMPRLKEVRPTILILDQFVQGQDSLPMIVGLRSFFGGGIVVLTGNEDRTDRIVALESGADDFVMKSLDPRELLARLRAVMRRTRTPAAAPAGGQQPVATAGSWAIDMRRAEVRAPNGTLLPLTRTEFQAFLVLVQNAGTMVSRDTLSQDVLGRPFSPLDRSVDNMVSRIRKALEAHVDGQPSISSVRGKGYVFDAFDLADAVVHDPLRSLATP